MKKILAKRDQLWQNVFEHAHQPGFFENNSHIFSRRAILSKVSMGSGRWHLPQPSASSRLQRILQGNNPDRPKVP